MGELGERFQAVLADAAGGDGAAFAELWRAAHPPLLRYLRVIAEDAAEDVASETWLKAMRASRRSSGTSRRSAAGSP